MTTTFSVRIKQFDSLEVENCQATKCWHNDTSQKVAQQFVRQPFEILRQKQMGIQFDRQFLSKHIALNLVETQLDQ